jgi:hypothetical protein
LARLHGGLGGSGSAASLVGAVRAADFGVAARLGYGTAGRMGGAQLRWYPPLPLPVASYVATGIDASPGTVAWHLALGAQVAVNERLRLELEGGVARSSTLPRVAWAPYASLGVSSSFPITLGPPVDSASSVATQVEAASRPAPCDAAPDTSAAALRSGIDAAVRSLATEMVVFYGSSFRGLTYRYRMNSVQVTGTSCLVDVWYEGSAVERLSGNRVEAEGVAQVAMSWNGCRWVSTSIDY